VQLAERKGLDKTAKMIGRPSKKSFTTTETDKESLIEIFLS